MSRFHKLPLKRKLILIGLLSAGIAMLLAGTLMFAAEFISFRDSAVRDLTIKAAIIGDQCTAALLFNVRKDAEENLDSLRADPDILYAAVYTAQGRLFARYRNPAISETWSLNPPAREYDFNLDYLAVVKDITVHNKRIGSIQIRSDQRKLKALVLRYVTAACFVILVSLVVAYILVSRLQSAITRPVMDLLEMMERISHDQDFTVRAPAAGEDELGALARGFNQMVSTIQDRGRELEGHRERLERTIADLERSSTELRDANEKLKKLDRMKSDFISVVSHELRTPLTAIKAFVELILMKPLMTEQRKIRLLTTINAESNRLTRLINELLDLTRIQSGPINRQYENVDVDEVIRNSIAFIAPLAEGRKHNMTSDIEPKLPKVLGDRDRLIQLMTNILSNAVKFTPAGGKIHVSARTKNNVLAVSVEDNGMGISHNDIELIFEKFHRSGDPLTSTVEGTGLGLAIAREIIKLHNGTISAESIYGKGSTFTFTLPIAK